MLLGMQLPPETLEHRAADLFAAALATTPAWTSCMSRDTTPAARS